MNLIIDVGNTLSKVAVFQQNEMVERHVVEKKELLQKIQNIYSCHPQLLGVIISKVSEAELSLPSGLQKTARIISLGPGTKLPFENLYATPQTLGDDRKALVAAAVKKYPQQDVLVIDAGTCITYDFKTRNNQYLGGAISPGLNMRFKALHAFTANLPLVEVQEENRFIGDSTLTCIHSGVVNGILLEIDGFIEQYKAIYPDLITIITGGDAQFLSINLKNSIFANSNFLLEGLNHILEFNISQ